MNAYRLALRSVLLAACLASFGCGSDADPGDPQSGGAGGSTTGGTGGSSGGSGGTGGMLSGGAGGSTTAGASGAAGGGMGGMGGQGGSVSTDTSRTEACIEYEIARRKRMDQCSQQPVLSDDAYARQAVDCPDVYFSNGSSRTIEGLLACAEVFRTFDCGQLMTARVPDCVTDGTLAAGEPCVFGPQCASLVCKGGMTACGACVMRLEPGATCDDGSGICPPGYSCSDGTCQMNLEPDPVPPIDPPQGDVPTGGACTSTENCMGDDLCLGDNAGGQICTARVPLDGSCDGPTEYCEETAYCSPDNVCVVLPTQGQPCGLGFGLPRWCAEGLTCDLMDATCEPTATIDCSAGGAECPDDSFCCFAPECATTMCVRIALPGEACGDESSRCINGSECMSGTCESVDSRGTVDTLCGP